MSRATEFATIILILSPASVWAAPTVANPSFEADRYTAYPGLARANGGKIEGWAFTGSVGIDPCWEDPGKPSGPIHVFNDNGKVPHGRQVVFLQNRCTLAQRIEGFEAGKRYRVTFYENARRQSRSPDPPDLEVTLGGETIVSRTDPSACPKCGKPARRVTVAVRNQKGTGFRPAPVPLVGLKRPPLPGVRPFRDRTPAPERLNILRDHGLAFASEHLADCRFEIGPRQRHERRRRAQQHHI